MCGEKTVVINGHVWVEVTNITYAGKAYPLNDIIQCGGEEPNFDSGG
jgi:hypothetical protein